MGGCRKRSKRTLTGKGRTKSSAKLKGLGETFLQEWMEKSLERRRVTNRAMGKQEQAAAPSLPTQTNKRLPKVPDFSRPQLRYRTTSQGMQIMQGGGAELEGTDRA